MLKAVLSDLDGVLVSACEWHYLALNRALQKVSGTQIELKEHHSDFNGLPTNKKLEMLVAQNRIDKNDIKEIWRLKQEYTKDIINETAKLDQEKIDLLKYIKLLELHVACVTNSILETATLMLEKTGQLKYYDFIISNDMVQYPKPHPEGYIRAMIKLGVYPDECLILEDSPKGIEAAKASGAVVFPVKDPTEVTLNNKRLMKLLWSK